MIEQVLYRRTVEQGYNEYCSRGLSKEEAHRVNIVMDTVASDIDDLGSGADSPFMLYPFETMHRFCLATFQREFSKGRSNSVNHGLLIEDTEYRELVKSPEQLWAFTNKNFLSRKVNHRDEMFALKALDISENAELSKDYIFSEYNLCNDGYLKLLNVIYTSLSKNKSYSCGLRIDNSKDANKVMRHMGYLIMCMLPYELRDKISFCSRRVPDSIGVTVQILQERDPEKTDITYEMSMGECLINNPTVEVTDFYLNDLLSMSDGELRDYFGVLAAFKDELHLSNNSEAEYVVSKLLKLSQKPEMFASETADAQFAFVKDVFALPTSNTNVINSIVVKLLPYVDSNRYMETFDINFGLYKKLNPAAPSDRQIMSQLEDNLVQNYCNANNIEKQQLFVTVFDSEKVHTSVCTILEKFVQNNEIDTDVLLANEYIKLYEEFFETKWKSALYWKIVAVFKQEDIVNKEKIWNRMYKSTNPDARNGFIYNILHDEDEPFHKIIFDSLVDLFINSQSEQIRERSYARICDVIQTENDMYRLNVLRKYNEVEALENSLWLNAYELIEDHQSAATNIEFLRCLKDKYSKSSNPQICDLYLDYLKYLPVTELESIIRQYGKQARMNNREERLLYTVINLLITSKMKISVPVLKVLSTLINDESVDDLASYISRLYLATSSESSNEIYDFLEREQPRLYSSPALNKVCLPSFDSYLATKINKRILKDDKKFLDFLHVLERIQYREESFSKIYATYQNWINMEITSAEGDFARYLKCKKLCEKIRYISQTQFGDMYCQELMVRIQDSFWKLSNVNTFDYEHCDIYKSGSVLYAQKFGNHENHQLAENISGLIEDSYVDWDKVYGILLSKRYISRDGIRAQIIKEFNKKYNEYGLSKSDPDYIAFMCVNKESFKMNYEKLFDTMQKYNYRVDDMTIRKMKIFDYIKVSGQLKMLVSEYKNYQSENPSYGEVVRGIFFEQIAVLLLLIANNVFRFFVLKMSENLKTRNILLLVNYAGYILIIIVVAVVSIWLMRRANMRRSSKYDVAVFGLLIANMLLSAVAIVLSTRFVNMFICLPVTAVLMIVLIIINIGVGNRIGRTSNKAMRRGDDIYE